MTALLEDIDKKIVGEISPPPLILYRSNELNKLFGSLAKAQSEMGVASNKSHNPYFNSNYAEFKELVRVSRPSLTKYGLCVIQWPFSENKMTFLHTLMGDASGQWIESKVEVIPPKPDIQTFGSYITYLKRYSYSSMTGVISSDEQDDDGEEAMKFYREKPKQEMIDKTKISPAQLRLLAKEFSSHPESLDTILNSFNINKMSDLAPQDYMKCIQQIKTIKQEAILCKK